MNSTIGKPISIDDHPADDGSHTITVEIPDFGDFRIKFSEAAVSQYVLAMQRGFLERWEKLAVAPQFPLVEVVEVGIGHGEKNTGLWVETAQSGVWGLYGSPESLSPNRRDLKFAAFPRAMTEQKAGLRVH